MKLLQKIKNVKEGLIVAAALSFLLCVYAPVELFLGSQDDFWFDLGTLFGAAACMFVAVYVLLVLVISLLRWWGKTAYNIGIGLYTAGFLVCYIQGTFFTGGLPALDGTNIDWSAGTVQRLQSIATVVAVVALLAFLLIRFKDKIFKKAVMYSSLALGAILALTLTTLCITTPIVSKENDLIATDYNDLTYSSDKNLIVLIVDATDNTRFQEVLAENPDFGDVFDDFTYYNDALAMYPYTLNALPSMLSGKWNENEMPYRDYVETAFEESPLINYLRNENYKIGLYNKGEIVLSQKFAGVFENQITERPTFSDPLSAAVAIAKMTAIRYAPWDIKFFGYNIDEHLDDSKESRTSSPVKKNNQTFYKAITKDDAISVVDEKCARIIHIEGSHVPLRYNKNVEVIEGATYKNNIECSVTICSEFILTLKESGVYDNSVVVILGDHGFDDLKTRGLKARANPFLLIKGIGDSGEEMKINSTPISYETLAQSFTELLNCSETTNTVFSKYSYPEGRRFIKYGYLSENYMTEYIFKGKATELDKVVATGRVFELAEE